MVTDMWLGKTYEHWELWAMHAAEKSETWKTASAEATAAARAKMAPVENCILMVLRVWLKRLEMVLLSV